MDKSNWQEEKVKREKESREKHARLSKLFKEDRLAFERERKRMIDEVISSAPTEELRESLQNMQQSWDTKMKHAGSETNRFVLARFFFWQHFDEVWQPKIQKINQELNKPAGGFRR